MNQLHRLNRYSYVPVTVIVTVLLLAAPATVNAGRVTDGLIALYHLDEGSGTTLHDDSGFGEPLDLAIPQGHLDAGWVTWEVGGVSLSGPGSEIASNGCSQLSSKVLREFAR